MIAANPAKTMERYEDLRQYLTRHVFAGEVFYCHHYDQCSQGSGNWNFLRGQLHHVGHSYDLDVDGTPYRIVVIGQEFGGGNEFVTLEGRRAELDTCKSLRQRGNPHQADVGGKPRNQHMTGTTSVLRVLLGLPPAGDQDSEFLDVGLEGRTHVFDMFALVNALLCSRTSPGSVRGRSTRVMRENCLEHLRASLNILEPTIIVVESKGYWPEIKRCFDRLDPDPEGFYRVRYGEHDALLAKLTHPSAGGRNNWGNGIRRPYLLNTVVPLARAIRRAMVP